MFLKLLKNHYKVLLISLVVWFLIIFSWELLNIRYQVQNKVFGKLSQEFLLTTFFGIITTVATGLYNFQKKKIEDNKKIFQDNNDKTVKTFEEFGNILDQQAYELRRIDDLNADLHNIQNDIKKQEKFLQGLLYKIERLDEKITQNDKLLFLTTSLREDLVEREQLKQQLKETIAKFTEDGRLQR